MTASDGTLSDTAVITVNVNNLNDNAPNIVDATVSLNENVAAGTAVVNVSDSFTGTDLDRDGAAITVVLHEGRLALRHENPPEAPEEGAAEGGVVEGEIVG